jgi:hypothetical protein
LLSEGLFTIFALSVVGEEEVDIVVVLRFSEIDYFVS